MNTKAQRIIEVLEKYESSYVSDFITFLDKKSDDPEDTKVFQWVFGKIPRVSYCKPALMLYSIVTGKPTEYFERLFKIEATQSSKFQVVQYVPINFFQFKASREYSLGLTIETIVESDQESISYSASDNSILVKFSSNAAWVSVATLIDGILVNKKLYLRGRAFKKAEMVFTYRIE